MYPSQRKRSVRRRKIMHALRRGVVTAEVVAERLGVSVRTVYRDIDALRSKGKPIDGAAGFGYILRRPSP